MYLARIIHAVAAPGNPGRSSSRRNTSVAFSLPNRTKPPAISFTVSGRQAGGSCIIKCPVTGVNPNLFCSLTRVRFGAPAFVSPRLSLLASETERRAREAAAQGRGGYVQARIVGATTFGAERVAADKVKAY
jgi:hypothetical protein